ncbi:MAG: tetratricopeptide repeat protein [Hormoscilla sp.]
MSPGKIPFTYQGDEDQEDRIKRIEVVLSPYQRAQAKAKYWMGQYKKVCELIEERSYDKALTACDNSIAAMNNVHYIWILRCYILLALERYEEALTSADTAIELKPTDADAWFWQSRALMMLLRNQKALQSCERAIELGCEIPYVFVIRAITFFGLGNSEKGISALYEAFEHNPAESICKESTALILRHQFKESYDIAIWRSDIPFIITIYDEFQALTNLGVGLVYAIPMLTSEMVSDFAAESWFTVWQELTSDIQEFNIPLRLLKASIHYKKAKKKKAQELIPLLSYEREIIQPILEGKEGLRLDD